MKQTDLERIHRLVVTPIARNWGTSPAMEMVEDMVKYLRPFSDQTLAAAMDQLVQTCKVSPRIAHIVEACRAIGGSREGDSSGADVFLRDLRKRDYDATTMAKAFVARFELTEQARIARAEGWDRPLMAYVFEAAQLQARYMTRSPNPGFNQNSLTNFKTLTLDEVKRRCRDLVQTCQRQAATGTIEVDPPQYLIEEWTRKAA